MSEPILVSTAIGVLAVSVHGSDRATVRGAGHNEQVQVGKFPYRLNLYFTSSEGQVWFVEGEWNRHSVYRADAAGFYQDPAPTIKDKIIQAAKEALLKALEEQPLAILQADTVVAKTRWDSAKSDYEKIRTQLELAQEAVNKAEAAFYEAFDREAEATAALAEKHI